MIPVTSSLDCRDTLGKVRGATKERTGPRELFQGNAPSVSDREDLEKPTWHFTTFSHPVSPAFRLQWISSYHTIGFRFDNERAERQPPSSNEGRNSRWTKKMYKKSRCAEKTDWIEFTSTFSSVSSLQQPWYDIRHTAVHKIWVSIDWWYRELGNFVFRSTTTTSMSHLSSNQYISHRPMTAPAYLRCFSMPNGGWVLSYDHFVSH